MRAGPSRSSVRLTSASSNALSSRYWSFGTLACSNAGPQQLATFAGLVRPDSACCARPALLVRHAQQHDSKQAPESRCR